MSNEFFKTKYVNGKPGSGELFAETLVPNTDTPVVCLGMEFPNDQARREYFTEKLREKLKDPEFRKIEGFPIGDDEDILALSDPPYYCACPNPWINDFIQEWEREKPPKDDLFHYVREPFAADVSEGKNDPIYNAHSYHTKVPHKAIMRYILHYTEPGDIVFDGFCGTGMTGVAAQMCGDIEQVRSLGYKVDGKGNIFDPEGEFGMSKPISKLGARKAILNDLSPAATFIAYNYNTPVDAAKFEKEAKRILAEVEEECGWMYETQHVDEKGKPILDSHGSPIMGKINYVVWSDVFICPTCMNEQTFWEFAVGNGIANGMKDSFACSQCGTVLSKASLQKVYFNSFDPVLLRPYKTVKRKPVLISYIVPGKKRQYSKKPDCFDLSTIEKVLSYKINSFIPTNTIEKGDKTGELLNLGIQHVNQCYFYRSTIVLSKLWERFNAISLGRFAETAVLIKTASLLHNIGIKNGKINLAGALPNALFVPSNIAERNIFILIEGKIKDIIKAVLHKNKKKTILSTMSTGDQSLDSLNNSIDYIFIDPPFGSNLHYSEFNFFWESWLKVLTNNNQEAIENKTQKKDVNAYRFLMTLCFSRAHKLLKPGRWMTVEFSNTNAYIWNSIQTAITNAGFVVANVASLNKGQGTFNSQTNSTSVKQDLVISAYKPNGGFEERFIKEADTEAGVWDFVRTHLKYLPVAKIKDGKLITIGERDPRLLFDQLVAYYVRKGYNVPISSQEFQLGVAERFDERDGLYYLPEQAAEYDRKKAMAKDLVTDDLFVSDEASAIAWLRKLLKAKTMTFQEINPLFMQELSAWNKHEKTLELSQLLEENFLCYDGKDDVPSQIHTYLSTNWHTLRELSKDDPLLIEKAKNRWYVPDPNKAGDLEKVREKSLLKEFEQYRNTNGRLKTFRLEAIRAGFKHAYQERDYTTILAVGKKIPQDVLEEDEKLLMWFEQAEIRLEK